MTSTFSNSTDAHQTPPDLDMIHQNSPATKDMLIEDFGVYVWLAVLSSVGFSGASFGLLGWGVALLAFLLTLLINVVTLTMAYQARQQKDALKKLADAVAVFGMLVFVVLILGYGLVIALIGLLFCLQIALNLIFREHRQVYFGLLIAFVALMGGAVHTFSSSYLIFMLLFCLFTCFYMAQIFVDRQRYQPLGHFDAQTSDPLPHIDDHQVSQANLPHEPIDKVQYIGNWRYGRRIGLAILISMLAGFIYLITPHLPAGNLGAMALKGYGLFENSDLESQILPEGTDLSDKFHQGPKDLQTNGGDHAEDDDNKNGLAGDDRDRHAQAGKSQQNSEQQQTSEAEFTSENTSDQGGMSGSATTADNSTYYYVKSNRPRYLQNQTQTYFDGKSWLPLQYGWKKLPGDYFDFTLYEAKPNAKVEVIVAKGGSSHLLTTDNTVGISFANSWVATDYYDQLKVGRPLIEQTQYQLHIVDEFDHNRLIDTHQAAPDDRDLQLPKELDHRVKELSDSIINKAKVTTDWQKAAAIEQHLRHSYEYTLDTLPQQNNIPLADFLFESQRGHCEYFATAMAVMLRQQGIPARLITGFVAHDYNPITGYYEVKGTNGHAWVSAYVDGHWAVFEATGAYAAPTQTPMATDDVRPGYSSTTPTTHKVLKSYLDNLTQQDALVGKVDMEQSWHEGLFEQAKMALHQFWYQMLLLFDRVSPLSKA